MRKTKTQSRRAFTLIEVMVVAVIVVLMLGMALPVFRAITGSRSEAGAANHVAAMLGRARSDAIGLQKIIGVAFLVNNSTQVQSMAEVEFPDCAGWTNQVAYVPGNCVTVPNGSMSPYFYCTTVQPATPGGTFAMVSGDWVNVGGPPLEMRQDTDLLPLPTGIGIQTVCNCNINLATGTRTSDGYLNVGVILFDGQGRIVSQNYGISRLSKLGVAASLSADYPTVLSPGPDIYYVNDYGVPSQFGLVVFQRAAFTAQGFTGKDVTYTEVSGSSQTADYTSGQQAEENWLDQNSTPLVLNRYTGTLIRAE